MTKHEICTLILSKLEEAGFNNEAAFRDNTTLLSAYKALKYAVESPNKLRGKTTHLQQIGPKRIQALAELIGAEVDMQEVYTLKKV